MNRRWRPRSPADFHQSNIFMRNYHAQTQPPPQAPPWGRPAQNLIRPQLKTDTAQQLSCDVVFGSPSANCMGTGICRISARTGSSPSASEVRRNCRSTLGLLFPIEGGNGVSMVLTRAYLCAKLYKTHLRHGTLILENPCPLPKDLAKTLGLTMYTIPSGTYLVQESKDFLRIDFTAAGLH